MRTKGFDWRRMPEYAVLTWAAMVFLYAPLIVLVIFAFNANRVALIWSGFSTQWFFKAFANADLRRAAFNSVIVAAAATPISTLFAVPAALAFERGRFFPGRPAGEALIALPLVAPEIVTAIATLIFFEAIGLRAGLINIILAHIVFCIPFAVLPIRARLREMPRDIEDAARDLYAGRWQVFRLVTLPLLMPAVIAGRDPGLRGVARRLPHHPDGGAGRGDDAAGLSLWHAAGRGDAGGQCGRHHPLVRVDRSRHSVVPSGQPPERETLTSFHQQKGAKPMRQTLKHLSVAAAALALGIGAAGSAAQAGGDLFIYNWTDYTNPDLIKKFEAESGVKVTLDTYDSNETLLAKLKSGSAGYDIVVVSSDFVPIFAKEGLIQKIDAAKLPGYDNIKDRWKSPAWDKDNAYTIPYDWGLTSVAVNTKFVKDPG